MRICLLSTTYPPLNTEGIARQRQLLAHELARQGHDVCVVTCGNATRMRHEHGVRIREIAVTRTNYHSQQYASLDVPLTYSQALYEGLLEFLAERPFDIVDVPLWAMQGFVTLQHYHGATVLWLQTTSVQLLAINGQIPTEQDRAIQAVERMCLERASGWLADSQAALESIGRDYRSPERAAATVAYLGIPPLAEPTPARAVGQTVKALVVGRLERRKGTPILFDVLPALLRECPQLNVRFVGRDNSENDGWREHVGTTYPVFFRQRYPEFAERVQFDGYVDDERLVELYQWADVLLVPSLYESFGLIYLEAMRAALPVVTFAAGGASEIFAHGEADGALLVKLGDQAGLIAAIRRIVHAPELRRSLGEHGLARFNAAFTAKTMADTTLAFYKQIAGRVAYPRRAQEVYQVMEALDIGDAVSNITRHNAALLAELGQPAHILTRYSHPAIQQETRPLHHALMQPQYGLIFHYWGYNTSAWILQALRGPKAVHYHNITPPHYFSADTEAFRYATQGYTQLRQIADSFDLIIGDSRYNVTEFTRYISHTRPTLHLYPVVDAASMRAAAYDGALLTGLRQSHLTNIVFVGRVVRNKRQDAIMRLFDHYYREINRHARLWLIGNDQSDPAYRVELEQLRESLASREQIVFTSKVSELEMNAYYRAADAFVCASEHEGFCVPLIQAMALDVPVLAYAASAVPETMGESGILVHQWDVERVSELMHLVLSDPALRQRILASQRSNLNRFSSAEARTRLAAIVNYLHGGESSPLFEWHRPHTS